VGCNCGAGKAVVQKTQATQALFRLARDLNVGDQVDVTLRTAAVGPATVRRIYLRSNIEHVDVWSHRTQTIVTAIPFRGDRIAPLAVTA